MAHRTLQVHDPQEEDSRGLMLYGVHVYLCANSLRRASSILDPILERSHEATRQWVQRLAPVCDGFGVERRRADPLPSG